MMFPCGLSTTPRQWKCSIYLRVRNLNVRPDLNGSLTSTYLQKGSKSATPCEQYVESMTSTNISYLQTGLTSATSEQYVELAFSRPEIRSGQTLRLQRRRLKTSDCPNLGFIDSICILCVYYIYIYSSISHRIHVWNIG